MKEEETARLLHEQSEMIRTWERDGFKLELFDLNKQDSTRHCICGYCFYDGGKLLFATRYYGIPYHQSVDGDEAVVGALGWVSLRLRDTDREFFEWYTSEQFDWIGSDRCQELQLLQMYLEELLKNEEIRCSGSEEEDHDLLTCPECMQAYWNYQDEQIHRGQDGD